MPNTPSHNSHLNNRGPVLQTFLTF